ncbi:MAG: leucine-rich repeat domain-containing protein [Clostridia bacterium]|nr:leucine-rich repeat domain-containing protein [Clostridia bacterium]
MKKGIIVGLIALTLLVGAFFIMLPQVLPQASEPDPELKFVGCNLSFADTIYVKYAVKGNDLSGVKLLIWTDPQTDYSYGSQNYVLNSIGTETVSGAQCLVFQYNKLAAKQMGDVIYARAFVEKQGNAYYSEVKKYSVLQYVYNKTGRTGTPSTNQKLIDLLEAMLEYGAKAQIYTNYKTNRLVSSNYYQVNVVGGMLPDGCDSGLYALGEVVTLTAPSTDLEGNAFSYWENDDGENVGTTATLDVTVISRNRTYTAVYGVETPVIPDPEYSTGLAYTDNGDGTCTITGIGTCTDLDVLIPPAIDGLTVSAIGEKAFENQTTLTDIVIPDTVTSIGKRAFYGCTGLTEFTIPSSVTSIGTQIFYHADNIHTVYYNASYYPATETENQLLNNAGITKVVFRGTYIGSYAASNLGLNGHVIEVEIVNSVTRIGDYAFANCTSISSIEIPNGVVSIGWGAFSGCTSLASVEIQDSVMSLGNYAFHGCTSLASVEISDSVTRLGEYVFYGCTSLENVIIPDSVSSIGDRAFLDCSNLKSVTMGNGVTSIDIGAFSGCTGITVVYYTGTLSDWLAISFFDASATPCIYGASLYISGELLTDVVIPDTVTNIDYWKFFGCTSIVSIEIPDSVTNIGLWTFGFCTSLAEITIPDSVTRIGGAAFCGCTNLANVYYQGTVEQWNSISKEFGWNMDCSFTSHFSDGVI